LKREPYVQRKPQYENLENKLVNRNRSRHHHGCSYQLQDMGQAIHLSADSRR
jgi:hypothetical protein